MKKKIYFLIIFVIILSITLILFILNNKQESPLEQACINSGGTITTSLCCGAVGDFPDSCAIGACGCSPDNSHEVKSCNCGENRCFNGTTCVLF